MSKTTQQNTDVRTNEQVEDVFLSVHSRRMRENTERLEGLLYEAERVAHRVVGHDVSAVDPASQASDDENWATRLCDQDAVIEARLDALESALINIRSFTGA